MLHRLPPPLKRRIRLAGCQAMAQWRRYPGTPALQQRTLSQTEAKAFTAQARPWQEITTPIPERGDATTCANRLHNLERAIETLHNHLIPPGEAFSLSQLLGEPTEAAGYRAGPVFIRGQVLSEAGGGLCLIATNLYQLFLHAGCRVLERHNHSIDAYGEERFYSLGEDAAIAYSTKDLAIRNHFQMPMLLQIRLGPHAVHSALLGPGARPVQTLVHSVVLERYPPSAEQQHPGWQVSTSRFSKQASSSRWRQDYLAFSHYRPC
ncbi:VanW family protein [Synechococcus sp. UW140]|uniref:VanW family protein n=1 Tax=Synechococcus sp. UW140 TaxID=368503 RepID=UPI0010BDDFC7|nr:VanW family protein [Synechococcus sp. UW140]